MSVTGENRDGQSGTTLVEALVVVTITALVALIGFPRLQQGLLVFSQRHTVAMVAARLRQARADALHDDRPAIFAIARDGRAYGPVTGPTSRTPAGVDLASAGTGAATIAFYGDGSSSGGRFWVIAARRGVPITVAPTGVLTVGGR